jgi:phosphoglycolate phosphatase
MKSGYDFSRIKGYVFDFDGTLSDTPLDFTTMHERAREAMLPFASIPEAFEGPVLEDIARVCAALPPAEAEKAREAAMRAIEAVEVETARRCRLFPFTRPVLAALARRGLPAAVVTRNCAAAVFTVFPDLREHVVCVLTREDVARPKPHPEHLLRALALMGVAPAEALMTGDHPLDLIAGKKAGSLTAGVASGGTPLARLAAEQPDFLAATVGELMQQGGIFDYIR